jgi:release factor glutamine methyltransferase
MNFINKILFPVLSRAYKIYSSKERNYNYEGIRIKVFPGVFHPGFFFSTKYLISYLNKYKISNQKVLELGAGTGMISVYFAKLSADVTASDISKTAIENIKTNAQLNACNIKTIHSDLFDLIPKQKFDFIIINPPYFPKDASDESELAWFCGTDFQYFEKLFRQLPEFIFPDTTAVMVLSENCDIEMIEKIAGKNKLQMLLKDSKKFFRETNFIYEFKSLSTI